MAFAPKVKKHITLPLLKMAKNQPYYVRFDSAIFQAKELKASRTASTESPAAQRREPPMLAQVTNLETGELCQIICPTILCTELNDNYPGESYKGRCFQIEQSRVEGKNYNLVNLTEIEDPDEAKQLAGEQAAGEQAAGKKKQA